MEITLATLCRKSTKRHSPGNSDNMNNAKSKTLVIYIIENNKKGRLALPTLLKAHNETELRINLTQESREKQDSREKRHRNCNTMVRRLLKSYETLPEN